MVVVLFVCESFEYIKGSEFLKLRLFVILALSLTLFDWKFVISHHF